MTRKLSLPIDADLSLESLKQAVELILNRGDKPKALYYSPADQLALQDSELLKYLSSQSIHTSIWHPDKLYSWKVIGSEFEVYVEGV